MNLDCYLKRDRKILHLRHFDGSQPVGRQIRLSSRANRKILRRFFGQHRSERGTIQPRVKYWEIIADNLSEAGWSWGCVSAVGSRGPAAPGSTGVVGEVSCGSSAPDGRLAFYLGPDPYA